MKLTNNFKLPQTLVNLHNLQREEYSKGDARMSVTQLLSPPRIDILRKQHADEMEDDISNRLWAVLGTVIHNVMERGADEEHIAEERLFQNIDGWRISGGIDVQRIGNQCKIIDYKFTSSWKYILKQYDDWEKQLNSYALLVEDTKGWDVIGLEVCMFVRDWMKSKADSDKDYPPAPCIPVEIPLWTPQKRYDFMRERIRIHKDALRAVEWDEEMPHCTDEERWKRESDFAAMKGENKRASRVFKNRKDCFQWIKSQKDSHLYRLEEREDKPSRCADNYCGVNKWCSQWQKEKDKWAD